jgi:hypothetical protein
MRDRSLDEFASGAETAADDPEEDPEAGEPAADGEAGSVGDAESEPDTAEDSPTAGVEPALSTYEWTPGGADCGRCGETVEKRWRDGDGTGEALVCAECKEW